MHSALPGLLAFPMIIRGQLIGMLLCGPKTEDDTYAPDERDALSAVAMAVGHALDGLRVTELEQTVERLLAGQPGAATQGAMGTF
jgi:GAF domain-containing protein